MDDFIINVNNSNFVICEVNVNFVHSKIYEFLNNVVNPDYFLSTIYDLPNGNDVLKIAISCSEFYNKILPLLRNVVYTAERPTYLLNLLRKYSISYFGEPYLLSGFESDLRKYLGEDSFAGLQALVFDFSENLRTNKPICSLVENGIKKFGLRCMHLILNQTTFVTYEIVRDTLKKICTQWNETVGISLLSNKLCSENCISKQCGRKSVDYRHPFRHSALNAVTCKNYTRNTRCQNVNKQDQFALLPTSTVDAQDQLCNNDENDCCCVAQQEVLQCVDGHNSHLDLPHLPNVEASLVENNISNSYLMHTKHSSYEVFDHVNSAKTKQAVLLCLKDLVLQNSYRCENRHNYLDYNADSKFNAKFAFALPTTNDLVRSPDFQSFDYQHKTMPDMSFSKENFSVFDYHHGT